MVILIGGSSHVGKTMFAQRLMEKYKWPYLSLDHLKMGLIRTGMTELTVEDDYEMRYFLFPIAAEMIKTVIENDQNLIVEGCYIPGEWRERFTEDYLSHIRCCFITMTEKYLRASFDSVCSEANVIERRLCDEPDLERLIYCSNMFRGDAERFAIPNLDIDGEYDPETLFRRLEELLGLTE